MSVSLVAFVIVLAGLAYFAALLLDQRNEKFKINEFAIEIATWLPSFRRKEAGMVYFIAHFIYTYFFGRWAK